MKEEKCGYCIKKINYKKYGTTDITEGYKATSKVWVMDYESQLQRNKFDWYAERPA